jgi:phosphoribosylanthranilate isomerase
MRVKICGLTRGEDAVVSLNLGAWGLGFIFYPQSERYIAPRAARAIIGNLPRASRTIGVFVNQTEQALSIAKQISLQGIQLHGDETPQDCRMVKNSFSGLVIKALRLETEEDIKKIADYAGVVDYILLDAAVKGAWGGTGSTGDWALAALAVREGIPLILAGGLTAGNILNAVRQVRPFAVDLSSGVEQSAGIKDKGKLEKFFSIAQGAEHG